MFSHTYFLLQSQSIHKPTTGSKESILRDIRPFLTFFCFSFFVSSIFFFCKAYIFTSTGRLFFLSFFFFFFSFLLISGLRIPPFSSSLFLYHSTLILFLPFAVAVSHDACQGVYLLHIWGISAFGGRGSGILFFCSLGVFTYTKIVGKESDNVKLVSIMEL